MIKRFCDMCGNEMGPRNTPSQGGNCGRMEAKLKRLDCEMTVEVITGRGGANNNGDFCTHCIIDAFYAMDDRPNDSRELATP